MCGIVGILNNRSPVDPTVLGRMNAEIEHRGPDEEGLYLDGQIGLAMRRLKVIDLKSGTQPIENEDRTCRIVCNGEIYNFPSLRQSLISRGHRFSSQSDTETILHLYEEHGVGCVNHLNGMFAFAIHDQRDGSVLIARDRIGIKPLYYAETSQGLIFGSEIKAILAHPDVSRELDPYALDEYLTFKFIPAPRTIYSTIRKLLPGHLIRWHDGRVNIERYWSLSFDTKDNRSERDLCDDFETRFTQSVRSQMLSDVPLGALLSGGLDSSMIVSTMASLSNRPIETFSIGFEEASYNELDHARTVAQHFGTRHHELVVQPDISALFDRVVGQFDEPFGDSSAVPTYLISELARQHVTVALSGTGADEMFAGYERYWSVPLSRPFQRLPSVIHKGLATTLGVFPTGHAKRSLINRAYRFLRSQSTDAFARHLGLVSMFDTESNEELYTDDFLSRIASRSPSDALRPHIDDSETVHDLDRLLGLDTRTILPDDYLTKDDRMSMATSLELRVPFLDHTLVEFAASCPVHVKLRGLKKKLLLKRMAAARIPKPILNRPKHGFEVPIAKWIGNELATEVDALLLSDNSRLRAFLRPGIIRNLVSQHHANTRNHSREIWSLMSLEMWLQKEAVSASDIASQSAHS